MAIKKAKHSIIIPTLRVEPEDKVVIVNYKSQTNMHYMLYFPI